MISRRKFLDKAVLGIAGASVLGSCQTQSETVGQDDNQQYEWLAVTTWPPNFPILGESVSKIAKEVEAMTLGRFKIKVYGGGELVPSLEVFDAVASGAAQMGHGGSYYWSGKAPASVFFCAIPFGMNAQQLNAWLFFGGGWELWKELYAPFNLLPYPCGNTGVQMGGWFNKPIEKLSDLQGLKIRMPGLGGKIITKAGASAITVAGGEIYTNLERGVIDAAEWIGPFHDYAMGFHRITKYYYYPGWHETGSNLEMIVNQEAYSKLPKHFQIILDNAILKYNTLILSEFEAKNNFYLKKMVAENGVQVKNFPNEVLKTLYEYSKQVFEDYANADVMSKKVYESYQAFKTDIKEWNKVSELSIVNW